MAGIASSFAGAKADEVRELLDVLAVTGVLVAFDDAEGRKRWRVTKGAA